MAGAAPSRPGPANAPRSMMARKTGTCRPEFAPNAVGKQAQRNSGTLNNRWAEVQRPTHPEPRLDIAGDAPDTQDVIAEFQRQADKVNQKRDREDNDYTPRKRQRTQLASPQPEPELEPPTGTRYVKIRHNNRRYTKCGPQTQKKRNGWIDSTSKDWAVPKLRWMNLPGAPSDTTKNGSQTRDPQDWNGPLLEKVCEFAMATKRDFPRALAALKREMQGRPEGTQLSKDIVFAAIQAIAREDSNARDRTGQVRTAPIVSNLSTPARPGNEPTLSQEDMPPSPVDSRSPTPTANPEPEAPVKLEPGSSTKCPIAVEEGEEEPLEDRIELAQSEARFQEAQAVSKREEVRHLELMRKLKSTAKARTS